MVEAIQYLCEDLMVTKELTQQSEQECYEGYARKAREYEQAFDVKGLWRMLPNIPRKESLIALAAIMHEAPRTFTALILTQKLRQESRQCKDFYDGR